MKLISIICPVLNEGDFIEDTLYNLKKSLSGFNNKDFEIFFLDGGSVDDTLDKLIALKTQYKFLNYKIIHNYNKFVSFALNQGIKLSKGKYIARFDSHSILPDNYFKELYEQAEILNSDNIGYAIETIPINNNLIPRSISYALSSNFGVGNSQFRVSEINKPLNVETVPYGFFKSTIFKKIGNFDEKFLRNQDDEFNYRIISSGGKIFLLPNKRIKYYGRDSFTKLSKMYFQYGLFKPMVILKTKFFKIRQLAPLLLVVSLFLNLFFYYQFHFPLFIPILYLFFLIIASLHNSFKKKDIFSTFHFLLSLLIIHFSYGSGFFVGIINKLTKLNINQISESR